MLRVFDLVDNAVVVYNQNDLYRQFGRNGMLLRSGSDPQDPDDLVQIEQTHKTVQNFLSRQQCRVGAEDLVRFSTLPENVALRTFGKVFFQASIRQPRGFWRVMAETCCCSTVTETQCWNAKTLGLETALRWRHEHCVSRADPTYVSQTKPAGTINAALECRDPNDDKTSFSSGKS